MTRNIQFISTLFSKPAVYLAHRQQLIENVALILSTKNVISENICVIALGYIPMLM